MATATLDKLRADSEKTRDAANLAYAELRKAEDAALEESLAKEKAEREKLEKAAYELEAKRLAALKAKADALDDLLRQAWPLIVELRKEQNIPHAYYQKAREAYNALARFYKKG